MSGEAAELEKVEEILADPSGHSTLLSGSALEIHVSKLPNLNNLLIDLATHSNWPKNCQIGQTPAALLAHANCNGQKTVKSLPAVTILDNFHGS